MKEFVVKQQEEEDEEDKEAHQKVLLQAARPSWSAPAGGRGGSRCCGPRRGLGTARQRARPSS